MSVYSVFIISSSGSLVFDYSHTIPKDSFEKKFDYPIPLRFKIQDGFVDIEFGTFEELRPGFRIKSVNGVDALGTTLRDGRKILEILKDPQNFPLSINFLTSTPSSDLKISLASLFHTMHSVARSLTPDKNDLNAKSKNLIPSGLQLISTKTHNFHCYETPTGVKFVMITDYRVQPQNKESLRRIYELYTDYALKNPLIDVNQPFTSKADSLIDGLTIICSQIERETKLQPLNA